MGDVIDPEELLGNFWAEATTDAVIQDPAELMSRIEGTVLCSYAAATFALKDRRLGSAPPTVADRFLWQAFSRFLILRDPPEHTAIRRLIARAFTKPAVESYRPQVQATIDALLDEVAPRGEMELVRDFAVRVPTTVIADLMGLAAVDREGLPQLLVDLEEAFIHQSDEAAIDRGEAAMAELFDRMRRALDERVADPGDDLLSRIAAGESADSAVDREDLVANAVFLLFAGQDSTKNTLVSCVYELLRHPDQMELLRSDPSLAAGAVEESLRFHPAIYGAPRYAREDMEFPQGTLPKGTTIDFFFGPANRDRAVFADPQRFDITRTENPHLAFAAGAHLCAGAPLARLELQLAVLALTQRLPGLRMVEQPRWRSLVPFRGLETLRLAWDPLPVPRQ